MRGHRVTTVLGVVLLAVEASGCASNPNPNPNLQVFGRDLGSAFANIEVARDTIPVQDAVVTVNGDALPFSQTTGAYSGMLSQAVPTGGAIHLEVTQGTRSVIGDGTVPAAPVLTGPLDSTTYAIGQDIVVTWTTDSLPDRFTLIAQWSCGPTCGGVGLRVPAARTDTTGVIPWSRLMLPPGTDVTVSVFAYNDGTLAGDYSSDTSVETEHALGGVPGIVTYTPGMNIRAESQSVVVHYGTQ